MYSKEKEFLIGLRGVMGHLSGCLTMLWSHVYTTTMHLYTAKVGSTILDFSVSSWAIIARSRFCVQGSLGSIH